MSKLSKILVTCQVIVIILLTYFLVLNGYVTSKARLDTFLVGAKTYSYTAEIVKSEIENHLPSSIKNNIVKNTIVTDVLDNLVTPKLIQKVSSGPLTRIIKNINSGTKASISGNKVVLNTSSYKTQISQVIAGWSLPPTLNNLANQAISSIPSQVTVVDLSKNPNSVVGQLVKTRDYLRKIGDIIVILAIILIALIVGLFVENRSKIRQAVIGIGWVLGISGILIIVLSYLGPLVLNSALYVSNPTTMNGLYNNMVINLGSYYLSVPGPLGIIFFLGSIVIYISTRPNFPGQINYLSEKVKSKAYDKRKASSS
jgi:hypothetical protein